MILGIVVALVVLTAVALRVIWLHDRSRPVGVDVALGRYRDQAAHASTTASPSPATSPPTRPAEQRQDAPITPPPVAALPAQGVYRYRTSGSESIDALDGARHDYPSETTMTVAPDGCGVVLRWEPLRERHDEWALCVGDEGIDLRPTAQQYHEFFSQPNAEVVACDRPVTLVPSGGARLGPVSQTCTLGGDPWLPTWEVLERGRRRVDGTPVEVVHVRMTIADDDEFFEHTTVDWYLDDRGLPVAVTARKTSSSPSPIGAVRYDEAYTLELISPIPRT